MSSGSALPSTSSMWSQDGASSSLGHICPRSHQVGKGRAHPQELGQKPWGLILQGKHTGTHSIHRPAERGSWDIYPQLLAAGQLLWGINSLEPLAWGGSRAEQTARGDRAQVLESGAGVHRRMRCERTRAEHERDRWIVSWQRPPTSPPAGEGWSFERTMFFNFYSPYESSGVLRTPFQVGPRWEFPPLTVWENANLQFLHL